MTEENNSIFEAVKVAYKALEDKFAMDIKVLDIKKNIKCCRLFYYC